jgi:hypothetical protein
MGYDGELLVQIIDNTAREYELTDTLAEALCFMAILFY